MTTRVRIEKADNNAGMSIMIQMQVLNSEGRWVDSGSLQALQFAAQLFEDHLYQNKRLVVYEMQTNGA